MLGQVKARKHLDGWESPVFRACTLLGGWGRHAWAVVYLGSCLTWTVVCLGSCNTKTVFSPGQLSYLGSCLTWAVVYLGSSRTLAIVIPGKLSLGQMSLGQLSVHPHFAVQLSHWGSCPPAVKSKIGNHYNPLCSSGQKTKTPQSWSCYSRHKHGIATTYIQHHVKTLVNDILNDRSPIKHIPVSSRKNARWFTQTQKIQFFGYNQQSEVSE